MRVWEKSTKNRVLEKSFGWKSKPKQFLNIYLYKNIFFFIMLFLDVPWNNTSQQLVKFSELLYRNLPNIY